MLIYSYSFGVALLLSVLSQILAQQLATPSPGLEACDLPADSGHCLAYFERWHFNSATGRCEMFIYGGCEGNANNFFTEKDCQQFGRRCQKDSSDGWPAGTWSPKGQGVPRAVQLLPREGQRAHHGRGRWPGVPVY